MITGNEPAMPIIEENTIEGHLGTVMQMHFSGLTIRQHFAAMAMAALLTREDAVEVGFETYVAEDSVKCANALITELNKINI